MSLVSMQAALMSVKSVEVVFCNFSSCFNCSSVRVMVSDAPRERHSAIVSVCNFPSLPSWKMIEPGKPMETFPATETSLVMMRGFSGVGSLIYHSYTPSPSRSAQYALGTGG